LYPTILKSNVDLSPNHELRVQAVYTLRFIDPRGKMRSGVIKQSSSLYQRAMFLMTSSQHWND